MYWIPCVITLSILAPEQCCVDTVWTAGQQPLPAPAICLCLYIHMCPVSSCLLPPPNTYLCFSVLIFYQGWCYYITRIANYSRNLNGLQLQHCMCLVVHICARLEPLHTCKEVKGGMLGVLVYTLCLFPWDRVLHQIQSSLLLNTVDDQQTPAKVLSLPPGLIGVCSESQILCGFGVSETWPSCLLRKLSYPLKHLCRFNHHIHAGLWPFAEFSLNPFAFI